MFPCPTCGTRNTRPLDKAITLWPSVQCSRGRKCRECETIFQTVEVVEKIIKGRKPPLGKQLKYPDDDTPYGSVAVIVRKLKVGDYMIAPNSQKANLIRNQGYKFFGPSSMTTKKKKRSKKYLCQRVS